MNTTTTYMHQPQPMYMAPPPVVVTQTTSGGGNSMRDAIPAFAAPYAILLCILNFFFPGLGTILAGFSVLCCGNVGQSGGGRVGTCCINIWVGILQLALAMVFIGWVWSIIWGYAFIASSASDDEPKKTTTTVVHPGMYAAPPPPTVVTTTTHHAPVY